MSWLTRPDNISDSVIHFHRIQILPPMNNILCASPDYLKGYEIYYLPDYAFPHENSTVTDVSQCSGDVSLQLGFTVWLGVSFMIALF